MKVECKIVAQTFDGMIPALNAGKFDAIISGMSATAKREEVIAFSDSYGSTGQTFATLKSSALAEPARQGPALLAGHRRGRRHRRDREDQAAAAGQDDRRADRLDRAPPSSTNI